MELDVRKTFVIVGILLLSAWNCHSETDCPQAFDASSCEEIQKKDCYNTSVKENCCNACSHWTYEISGCEYGDRRTDCQNISRKSCYERDIQNDCCFTCYYLYNERYPDCFYGDKEDFCNDIDMEKCANDTVASTCCQRCGFLLDKGCDGDTSDRCSNTYSDCYNVSFEKACCETCYEVYDEYLVRDTDCMYGDRGRNCNYLSSRECYNETKYQECCYHCYQDIRNNEMPNCLYGNRDSCGGIQPRDCYDTNIRDKCCETCDSWMNVHAANCEYGDRVDWCFYISQQECYNDSVVETCCKTCFSLRTDITDCWYGDRRTDCMLDECTAYSTEDKQQCCQTCKTIWPLSTTPSPKTTTPSANNTALSSNKQSVSTRTMTSATTQINYVSTQMPNRTTLNQNSNANAEKATGSAVPAAVGGAIGGFVAVVLLVFVVYILWRRGYCTKSSPISISEGKYNVGFSAADYMNNLENQPSKKDAHLGQQENVYDYINPNDVNSDSSVISGPTVQAQYDRNQVEESYDNPRFSHSHSEDGQMPQDDGGYLMLQRDDNNSSYAYYSISK